MLSINYDCDCRGMMRREVERRRNGGELQSTSAFSRDAGVILSNAVRADSSPCETVGERQEGGWRVLGEITRARE